MITKQDFDNAVKQQWSSMTCVVSQMVIRLQLPEAKSPNNIIFESPATRWLRNRHDKDEEAARLIMGVFDDNFQVVGDENKPQLRELRESLPE